MLRCALRVDSAELRGVCSYVLVVLFPAKICRHIIRTRNEYKCIAVVHPAHDSLWQVGHRTSGSQKKNKRLDHDRPTQ